MLSPIKILCLSISIATIILGSCKREVVGITGNEDEKGIDQLVASEKLNAVETNKPALSELKEEVFEANQLTFSIADSIYYLTDSIGKTKVDLLINGPTILEEEEVKLFQGQDAFGWIISSIDQQVIANKDNYFKILYFNGKYLEYNNKTKEANWGYYYIDKNISKIGFDYNGTEFHTLYSIINVSDSILSLSIDNQTIELEPYYINGVENNYFVP